VIECSSQVAWVVVAELEEVTKQTAWWTSVGVNLEGQPPEDFGRLGWCSEHIFEMAPALTPVAAEILGIDKPESSLDKTDWSIA